MSSNDQTNRTPRTTSILPISAYPTACTAGTRTSLPVHWHHYPPKETHTHLGTTPEPVPCHDGANDLERRDVGLERVTATAPAARPRLPRILDATMLLLAPTLLDLRLPLLLLALRAFPFFRLFILTLGLLAPPYKYWYWYFVGMPTIPNPLLSRLSSPAQADRFIAPPWPWLRMPTLTLCGAYR